MARALMGHVGTHNEQVLAYEVARLRRRVTDLETELAELRAHRTEVMDLELHHLAESAEPALA